MFMRIRQRPASTLFPYTTLFRSLIRNIGPSIRGAGARSVARQRKAGVLGGERRPGRQYRRLEGGVSRVILRSNPKDRKSTRLNSSHMSISYAVFCLKKKKNIVYI